MNKISLLTKSKKILARKLFACVVSFFIIISSYGFVSETQTSISLLETAKVSAGTVIAQFFYISTLPLNIISKLFTSSHNVDPLSPVKNDKNKAKESNSSKASFGYLILPTSVNSLQMTKTKTLKNFVLPDKIKKSRIYAVFDNIVGNIVSVETFFKFNIIMILLLTILLTRRNVGDDNIVLNIKNNRLARLIL